MCVYIYTFTHVCIHVITTMIVCMHARVCDILHDYVYVTRRALARVN